MLDTILSQLVNGIVLGTLYVLIALGLSMVFGVLGIVNMTHGVFVALGAHFALSLQQRFGWPAVAFAPFLTALVGALVERTLIWRTYGKEPLNSLILTFALALLIEAVMRAVWGPGGQPFQPPDALRGIFELGPVLTTRYRIVVLAVTVVLLVLWALLLRTPFGRILRAGSRDPEMVGMLGINLRRLFTAAFALGCFLAGMAGLLAAPMWAVSPTMGAFALMPAFVIVTIGGLGSYAGAVIAGLLVGVVTSLAVQFFPEGSAIAMYCLMFLILIIRPRGLFGERWERFE
jgi:branched-chain amino acid transport system permease protein